MITNSGTANSTLCLRFGCPPASAHHTIHDIFGNVIAELDGTGNTVREYIYLPEAEIAPTRGSRTTVDRPIAVVDGVNTTPVTLYVHVDHLNRPVRMTNATKATVWDVIWTPWGAPHTITGAQTLNARFPGQWFQLEAGLHYNWHRHYDPSLGRYTQADPLGFVDGPSVYAYAKLSPSIFVDPDGRRSKNKSTPGGFPIPDSIFIPGSPSNTRFVKQCLQLLNNLDGPIDIVGPPDYDQCIEACEGRDEIRAAFCRRLPNKTKEDKARRARCWQEVHESEQHCKGWGEEEFGNN